MSITRNAPNTVFLGGPATDVAEFAANETITPGMLVERYTSSTKLRLRKHATAGGAGTMFACEQAMLNKGISDDYSANDLVQAKVGGVGSSFYALITSGANIGFGDKLESAGNGKLRAFVSGAQSFRALEAVNNSSGPSDARIRVEVE